MPRLTLCFVFVAVSMWIPATTSAQSVPEKTGSRISSEEAQAALGFHNRARAEVGSPPLKWSEKLSEYAQAWADELASTGCKMKHRPHSGKWKQQYGENIYWCMGFVATATDASEDWYSEIKDYKHGRLSAQNFSGIGHYTQMVWKSTRTMGVGVAHCRNGQMIIVANYDPPGNYMGELPY